MTLQGVFEIIQDLANEGIWSDTFIAIEPHLKEGQTFSGLRSKLKKQLTEDIRKSKSYPTINETVPIKLEMALTQLMNITHSKTDFDIAELKLNLKLDESIKRSNKKRDHVKSKSKHTVATSVGISTGSSAGKQTTTKVKFSLSNKEDHSRLMSFIIAYNKKRAAATVV